MSLRKTLTRTVATAAASAALVVGAAGVASAASMSHDVDGNTVSATFSIGIGDISMPVDGCVAVVAERSQQQGVFNRIKDMVDLDTIGDTFRGETTTVLRAENNSPVAVPAPFRPVTLSANDIPDGVHSLITYCATDTVPVTRTIVVGDAENTMGSIVSDGPALISSGMNFL